jgi:hypothetical protein
VTDDERARAFHWEMYRSERSESREWGSGIVMTLLHLVPVVAVSATEPLAGLALGGVFAVFWGGILLPPWIRDLRSVVATDIRPGPTPVLVLRRRSGGQVTHHLDAVTEVRPLTVGYRSAGGGGSKVLELRVGRKAYRTRAAFNPPENDVRLLEKALRKARPQAKFHRHEDRTSWVSDSG